MTIAARASEKQQRYRVRDPQTGKLIGTGELRSIPVGMIRVDPAYQRDVSQHWVETHLPFDPRQAGTIVISERAGVLFCIDGGHRVALARASDVEYINAFVIHGLSQAQEARYFTRYQRERRNLKSFDLYRADRVSGDPEVAAMERIVHNAGFQITKAAGVRNITAIEKLKWIHRFGGDDLLARTLDYVKRLWIEEPQALNGQLLKGLAIFLADGGSQPQFSRERFERVMTKYSASKIMRLAQAVASRKQRLAGNQPTDIAVALQEEYNKLSKVDQLPPLKMAGKTIPSRARGTT